MIEITARSGKLIDLGRRGENRARRIAFDISKWRRVYGEGTVQILHRRKGDEAPYPVAVEMNGEKAYWVVGRADVACPGTGALELQYRRGETVVKSAAFCTRTWQSLGEEGPAPDEPQQGWVEQMLKAVRDVRAETAAIKSDAETAAQRAEAAAEKLEESGGGESLPKPLTVDYLPTGVPYVEKGSVVEVLPDYVIASEADMTAIPALGLEEGKTYTVVIGGAEYECVAQSIAVSELAGIALGDIYTATGGAIGSAATGEPFVLLELSPEIAAEAGINVTVQPLVDVPLPITVSIRQQEVSVNKLDNRCLDLAWLPVIHNGTGEYNRLPAEFLPENTATTEDISKAMSGLSTESWTFVLNDGSTVTKAVYVG